MKQKGIQIIFGVLYALAVVVCLAEFILVESSISVSSVILITRLLWLGFPFTYGAIIGASGLAYAAFYMANMMGFEITDDDLTNKFVETLAFAALFIAAGVYQWIIVAPRIVMRIHRVFTNSRVNITHIDAKKEDVRNSSKAEN